MPFYFCPRSVMLYLIHKANHPELDYHGGQGAILHLESDLNTVIAWANNKNVDGPLPFPMQVRTISRTVAI